MLLTHEEALQVLGLNVGLEAGAEVDAAAVQRAFERLARRYPQSHFPERFHRLLAARDTLLDAGRQWRELLESRTLDLDWLLPHLTATPADARQVLQDMLRAGFLAEPLEPPDLLD